MSRTSFLALLATAIFLSQSSPARAQVETNLRPKWCSGEWEYWLNAKDDKRSFAIVLVDVVNDSKIVPDCPAAFRVRKSFVGDLSVGVDLPFARNSGILGYSTTDACGEPYATLGRFFNAQVSDMELSWWRAAQPDMYLSQSDIDAVEAKAAPRSVKDPFILMIWYGKDSNSASTYQAGASWWHFRSQGICDVLLLRKNNIYGELKHPRPIGSFGLNLFVKLPKELQQEINRLLNSNQKK